MIIAITRVKSIEGTTMTLESSVTVFENDDLVSFDKESKTSAAVKIGRLKA